MRLISIACCDTTCIYLSRSRVTYEWEHVYSTVSNEASKLALTEENVKTWNIRRFLGLHSSLLYWHNEYRNNTYMYQFLIIIRCKKQDCIHRTCVNFVLCSLQENIPVRMIMHGVKAVLSLFVSNSWIIPTFEVRQNSETLNSFLNSFHVQTHFLRFILNAFKYSRCWNILHDIYSARENVIHMYSYRGRLEHFNCKWQEMSVIISLKC